VLKYGHYPRDSKKKPIYPPKKTVLEEDFEMYDEGAEDSETPAIDEQMRYHKLQNIQTEETKKHYLYDEIALEFDQSSNIKKKNENRS